MNRFIINGFANPETMLDVIQKLQHLIEVKEVTVFTSARIVVWIDKNHCIDDIIKKTFGQEGLDKLNIVVMTSINNPWLNVGLRP